MSKTWPYEVNLGDINHDRYCFIMEFCMANFGGIFDSDRTYNSRWYYYEFDCFYDFHGKMWIHADVQVAFAQQDDWVLFKLAYAPETVL